MTNQNLLAAGQSFQICLRAAKNVVIKGGRLSSRRDMSSKSLSEMQKLRRRKTKRSSNSLRKRRRSEELMSLREKQRRSENKYKRWPKIRRKSTASKQLSTPRRICNKLLTRKRSQSLRNLPSRLSTANSNKTLKIKCIREIKHG